MFEIPAGLLAWFYSLTNDYTFAIALIAVVVMAITTPLTLKSTKGMLEMQRLAPEMRKLQNEHRNDRQKLNEEMMKLYQEHKVNPAASCLPIVAQMPIFLTPTIPCRVTMLVPVNARYPTVVMAEPLRKLRLVRPMQPQNARFLISVSLSATVTSATSWSSSHSPTSSSSSSSKVGSAPVYTTAFDISEEQGGRGAEGVDAVEGEASRGTQRWVARAR